jgi:polar amino acid transport system substrate-binding protein
VVSTLLTQDAEVAAGVRQQLEADAGRHPGLRLTEGRFTVIRQAMGLHNSRGEKPAAYLTQFVDAMKACSFVADALTRHGINGASVAPATRE